MDNLQHHLNFESPTQSSLDGYGLGPGGWHFHPSNAARITAEDSYFGSHSLQFLQPAGNISKYNNVGQRLIPQGSSWTFSFFFKNIRDDNTFRTLVQVSDQNDPDAAAHHPIYLDDTGHIGSLSTTGTFNSGSQLAISGYNDNEWHHMLVRSAGSNIELFIDSINVAEYANPVDDSVDNYLTVIGTRPRLSWRYDTVNQLVEYVDNFKFFDRSLSSAEILQLYNEIQAAVRLRLVSN
jgi:hypothetical protein